MPVTLHVERHRGVVIRDRRRHQHVGVAGPGAAVLRNGEVHLERDGAVGGAGQVRRGDAAALRHGREGVPAPGRQKPLERQLVLTEGGAIELAPHVSAEGRVAEREREGARQELGVSRRGEDIRPTRGVGCGAGWAVGAGERAHQQGERRCA